MKSLITILFCLLFSILWSGTSFATYSVCELPYQCFTGCPGQENQTTFRRTYSKPTKSINHKTTGMKKLRSGDATVIGKSHFEDHLDINQNRLFTVIPLGNSISMDVGVFDQFGDEAQVWIMPDFGQYLVSEDTKIEHITPEDSGFGDAFPEATHCFYMEHIGAYEFMELTEDDLFLIGRVEVDENDLGTIFDIYMTVSPVPLELGLEFEGSLIIEYTDDPDIDSLVHTQVYTVSGYGTLNTYDDGPVEAIKLNYTHTNVEYKDGQVIDSIFLREIVWYSVRGHYLKGRLAEGSPLEGQTMLANMKYQRLDTGVSTKEVTLKPTSLNYFPNPVSAGDVLTITHTSDTHFGLVRLYDIQGRLVQQLDLSGMGAVRNFQVQLPSDLVAGMYMYQVQSPKGESLGQGKLNVR
jgi:hypothetical protein